MEKHGLRLTPTTGMSRAEWLQRRMDGVGGSDISSILGLNHRFSAVELFYQRIGFTMSSQEENEAMFWGSRNEDKVLDIAQYYDHETGQYIDNYNTGNKLREISKLSYMVNNPQYPHIIANLDGAENFDEELFLMDGPAESKTISRQTAEMYANGMPPYHLIQIQTYCIVCAPMMRQDRASIYYLEDGNKFRGLNIPVIESIKEQIIQRSADFWDRVVNGREIMATVKDNDTRLKYLAQIEPDMENHSAYYDFLSELFKYKQSFIRIDGTRDDYENAIKYKLLGGQIKDLENERQVHKNAIMERLHKQGANIMQFAGKGKITFNKKLYVTIREEAAEL